MSASPPATMTVREVIARDLEQKIEEIVKVNQDDDTTVYNEITEYVATDHITNEYRDLFEAIADGPARPDEGVGIWVSGFFGSGKSSFAKNLGYALRNSDVFGTPAGQLLAKQLDDTSIKSRIDFINHRIPTTVLMFDVTSERAVVTNNERIAQIVYNVLLRELGYPEDWTLADLEISLESEGKLDTFLQLMAAIYGGKLADDPQRAWRRIAKTTEAKNRASAILHQMDPATYPSPDSWAHTVVGTEPRLDVNKIVERMFELMGRRRQGQALAIVIDEVGQYVGRSSDKIEDLRAFVEQVGKESANRVKRKLFPAPVWVVITSQERLDEVVSALDGAPNLLPKLQDRFHHSVDLVPADIREVATKRVLGKTKAGSAALRDLFAEHEGRLESYTEFERSSRVTDLDAASFAQFYPFLPHFIDLSIDVMTGLRAKSSGYRQTGAANRTIIKQAHEMLVGEPKMAEQSLGTLVTLDKIYDLVRHSAGLDQNHKIEMGRIRQEFGADSWESRVTKALALLEMVKNLPRSDKNIAAVLYDRLGADSPLPQVQAALERLEAGQYVRQADDGWKLQTAEEKQWEKDRLKLDPRPKDINETLREAVGNAFAGSDLRSYKHQGRTFKVGLSMQMGQEGAEIRIGDDGPLSIWAQAIEAGDSVEEARSAAQDATRDPKQQHALFWVFSLDQGIDSLARDLLRSKAMVAKYDRIASQGKLPNEERSLLQQEKITERRLSGRLADKVAAALYAGTGFHAGNTYDGSDLGNSLAEAIRGFLGATTPQIFPKLVAASLSASDPGQILTAANLSNLPAVFYADNNGLGLVVKRDNHFVVDEQSQLVTDVLRYLERQKEYGETKTGKEIADHFAAPPYGWELEIVRLILAALLRSGKILVTHEGRQHKSYQNLAARAPFSGLREFRSATFEPRVGTALKLAELTDAVQTYENLTGHTVDVDQEAIASRFREYAGQELTEAKEIEAVRSANRLPQVDAFDSYRSTLTSVATLETDEAVRKLGGSAKSLREGRETTRQIKDAIAKHLDAISLATIATNQMWPALRQVSNTYPALDDVATELSQLLNSAELYTAPHRAATAGKEIAAAFHAKYQALHRQRAEVYATAIEEIRSLPEWAELQPVDETEREARAEDRHRVLGPLEQRACVQFELSPEAMVCTHCGGSLGQLTSDILAVSAVRQDVIAELHALTTPTLIRKPIRVRELSPGGIASEEEIGPLLADLGRRIREALAPNTVVVLE